MPEIFQHDYPALSCVQACKVYSMQHDYSGPLVYQYDDGTSQTVEVHVDSVVAAKVLTQRMTQGVLECHPFMKMEKIADATDDPKPSTAQESVEPVIDRSMAVSMVDDNGNPIGPPPTSREQIDRLNEEYEQERQVTQQTPEAVSIAGLDGNPVQISQASKEAYDRAWNGPMWEHEGVKYRLADERDIGKKVRLRSDFHFVSALTCDGASKLRIFTPGAEFPYFTSSPWKYVWVPLEDPAEDVKPNNLPVEDSDLPTAEKLCETPALPAYNPGPHPPIPEGWYAIGPDEVIAEQDMFSCFRFVNADNNEWLFCAASIGNTVRRFGADCQFQPTVIRKKPTRWRACKTLSEFEPFWGLDVVQKHNGRPDRCNILSAASGCTMEWYFLNQTTIDGNPIGVEEVVEPEDKTLA